MISVHLSLSFLVLLGLTMAILVFLHEDRHYNESISEHRDKGAKRDHGAFFFR